MNNKIYLTFESFGTVLWLLTDFIWMCGYPAWSLVAVFPAAVFLIGACIFYNGGKSSDLNVLIASLCWFSMNAFWISSEIAHKDLFLWCSKGIFLIACFFVYLSFRASKKEGKSIDFKRLKLK
jgi:hypothetical protein